MSKEKTKTTITCPKCNSYNIRFFSFRDTHKQLPLYRCDDCGAHFELPEMVRLEDAEQEIEKIKGLAEETSRIMIEAEREELKQKLQQRYDECKRIEETTASPLWREGARWNMKLIEELLKEEQEAKKEIDAEKFENE
jgi:DNA-directed RNA polymerase subunit RPC12/RpoP